MARIPQSFINELLVRVDVVDVISTRISLKKAGKEFTACCPFHDEKTPSFTVSRVKQFYHCFGCGENGTAISFLMTYDHLGFVDAIEELASIVGITVPYDETSEPPDKTWENSRNILKLANQFYKSQLKNHPEASVAVDYLKNRGLSGELAAIFQLGYAPPGWSNLYDKLAINSESKTSMLEAGLVIEKDDGRSYDRFRNRIVFPICDQRGRVIAFGGRVLTNEKPKYLNSPETKLFHKGKELYGLYEAMQANRELESLIVVEGYMDVIALAQHGIRNVVATLGTAITEDHLTRLFKLIKQVIFCFDGDRAGADAAKKAFKIVLPLMQDGRQVKFLLLPEKEDPDSMVRRCGATDFKERINNAMNFSDFLFSKNLAKCDMESIDGRAKLVNISLPLINQIPHGIFREMLLKQLAGFGQIDVNTINAVNHVDNAVNQQESVVNNIPQRKQKTSGLSGFPPVRRVICLLLQYPHFASLRDDEQNWSHLKLPGAELLAEMFDILNKNPALKTAAILEHWRERQEEKFLFKLAQIDLEVSEKDSEKNFLATFDFLKQEMIDDRKNNLLNKSKTNQLNQDEMIELNKLLKTKIL